MNSSHLTESLINAELTIGSLMVLGFNANDYVENYPTIAWGMTNLTVYSFDKHNEKSLMIALHFLLNKLDGEFTDAIKTSWPYTDVKTKNETKRAIQSSFERLVRKNWLAASMCKSSILSVSKGPEVWTLLRALTDICVEVVIAEMNNESTDSIPTRHYDTVEMRDVISAELVALEDIISSGIHREKEHGNYFSELDARLRKATKNIETSRQKLQSILTNDVPLQILTESGRLQRSEWIEKLGQSKALLLNLAQSPLLVKAKELLMHDKRLMEGGRMCTQTSKSRIDSIPPDKWNAMMARAGELLQKQQTQTLTTEEQEVINGAQRTLLHAVNDLIAQIDQIPVV
jgi:hypothetical protein